MPATSHYKAKGRPTIRKAMTALHKAIGRKGCGVKTMPYLGSGRRGKRRGGFEWMRLFELIPGAPKVFKQYN
jgi:hypothetical protein